MKPTLEKVSTSENDTSREYDFNLYQPEPLLIVISGPSGVGKDSVVQLLITRNQDFHFVVTATSRLPREGETHGVDYFFFTREKFEDLIAQNELLEYAKVYEDYKGVPKEQVRQAMDSGKDVVMRLDVQGAATIRKMCPEALLIFISTETEDILINRLIGRGSDSPEQIEVRVNKIKAELIQAKKFDYVILNRDQRLPETVETIEAIIQTEHHRIDHRKVTL
jgi:guanylate kinase